MSELVTGIIVGFFSVLITMFVVMGNANSDQIKFNAEFARCVNVAGRTSEGYAFCIEELAPQLSRAINEGRQFPE